MRAKESIVKKGKFERAYREYTEAKQTDETPREVEEFTPEEDSSGWRQHPATLKYLKSLRGEISRSESELFSAAFVSSDSRVSAAVSRVKALYEQLHQVEG